MTVPCGVRYVDEELRIYDAQQLEELTTGFVVLKRQLYRKAVDATHWLQCAEADGMQAGYDPVTGVQGVAKDGHGLTLPHTP